MLLRTIALGLLVVGAVQITGANSKVAAYTQVSGTGYFSGGTEYADGDSYSFDVIHARPGGNAIPSSVYSGKTSNEIKTNYINWLNGYVTQDNLAQTHDLIGGAFITNSMLGLTYPGSTRTVSSGMWNDLVSRINRPDITASWVTMDPNSLSPTTSFNNYGLGIAGANDVFYAKWNPVARPIILFKNSAGTIVFAIEIPCGNPLGGFPGLPKIPPDDVPIVTPSVGGVAGCTTGKITGAAWDPDSFGTALTVQVYMGGPMGTGTKIATVKADDLESNGHTHGYSVTISSYIQRNQRSFYLYANNVDPWGRPVSSPAYGSTGPLYYGPCNDSSCGPTNFPATMEVGVPQSFQVQVKLTYTWGSPYSTSDPAMYVTILDPNGSPVAGYLNKQVMYDAGYPSAGTTLTSNVNNALPRNAGSNITFTPAIAGVYQMQWSLKGSSTNAALNITCPGPGASDYKTGRASFLPYVSVYGGDVIAGSSPVYAGAAQPSTCSAPMAAGVYSWNTGSPSYVGAGASYAVMALGQIQDFASTQGSVGAPDRLSFANTTAKDNPPSGLFGGDAGSVPATCDFVSGLTTTSPTPGNRTFTSFRPVAGPNNQYFINGNVRISGDGVKYPTTSWGSTSAIPNFKLIVIGDIFIDSSVDQLDGLYVAMPDSSGAGGHIYTCSNGFSAIDVSSPNFYTDCSKKLTINGAFVAKSVQFLRTFGSMSKPNSSAEQFNYSPELWLPRTVNSVGSDYNSITGLPPVL